MTKQAVMLGVALAVLPAALMAQESAYKQLKKGAGDAVVEVKEPEVQEVEGASPSPLKIPDPGKYAKDVFADCGPEFIVSGRGLSMGVTLPQAVEMVQVCLDKTYNRPSTEIVWYTVKASAGRFGVRNCPDGNIRCGAVTEVDGIIVTVGGKLMMGNPVIVDLNYSLGERYGKLLGWNATLDNKAEIIRPQPRSALFKARSSPASAMTAGSCIADGDSCVFDDQCCGGACRSGQCEGSRTCSPTGGFCTASTDCCGSNTCDFDIIPRSNGRLGLCD